MDKDNLAELVVNGKSSFDYGIAITYPYVIAHPEIDVSPVSILGHSGDYLTNNHRYKNTTQTLNLYVTKPEEYSTWSQLSGDINQWLTSDKYIDIHLTNLHEWYLEGYVSTPLVLTPSEDSDNIATGSIAFDCKPFMKRVENIHYEDVPETIINNTNFDAEPIFHILGNGNFTVTLNDLDYKIIDVDGEVTINSEEQWTYKSNYSENMSSKVRFPNNDFPVLKVGKNTIKISGNFTKFEYKPNWRRLS